MTTAYAPAPAGITPRDISFDVDASRMNDWAEGSVIRSTWSNALSLMFPIGERFFISSVAAFKNVVTDPEQLAAVKAFVTQEGLHTREHIEYNELMRPLVDVDATQAAQAGRIALLKKKAPPIVHLAITCALEHFTAIMAHDFLSHPELVERSERSFARLWTWHAIEECEHKSVAFDVYTAAMAGETKKALRLRRITMATVTVNFLTNALGNCNAIFAKAGTNRNPITWAKLGWFLFGTPGLLRRVVPAYLQYYRADFHPAQIDDAADRARGLAYLNA